MSKKKSTTKTSTPPRRRPDLRTPFREAVEECSWNRSSEVSILLEFLEEEGEQDPDLQERFAIYLGGKIQEEQDMAKEEGRGQDEEDEA